MALYGDLLWTAQVNLEANPLNARLYRYWKSQCRNVFGDILGAQPVSDPTYLGGMFWTFHDPHGDGSGKGWALEPADRAPDFFSFVPFNANLPSGGGSVDVVVYVAATGAVVSYDYYIGPGRQGDPRPSPLHNAANVVRVGKAATVADDPRVDPLFWEATEIGGNPSVPYWAVRMWLVGAINWLTMPLRLLLLDDSWPLTRRNVKYVRTTADIPAAAVIGVSEPVPLTRHVLGSFVMVGEAGPPPSFDAVPVLGVPEGRTVGAAALYHDGGAHEILRICQVALTDPTSGTDPVWLGPITIGLV